WRGGWLRHWSAQGHLRPERCDHFASDADRDEYERVTVTANRKPEKDEKTGRFLTGNSGGGRPKGSRNKLGEAFLEDMLADWEANGPAAIREVRETKPDAYLKVVASILPKDLNVNINQ